jgi:hypothetical protein
MLLKGALHVHTTCSDGALSVGEVLDVYRDLGFDFVALTDHDYLLRAGCYERQLAQVGADPGLIVFTGVELTVFEKGYVHVNRVDGDREVLHFFNHPSELDLPLDRVIDRISSVAQKLPLDAVEVTTKGFYTPEYDTPEIPYPKLATDDAHTRIGCGRAWIELDCQRQRDAILRAVKQGEFWNCYITH